MISSEAIFLILGLYQPSIYIDDTWGTSDKIVVQVCVCVWGGGGGEGRLTRYRNSYPKANENDLIL